MFFSTSIDQTAEKAEACLDNRGKALVWIHTEERGACLAMSPKEARALAPQLLRAADEADRLQAANDQQNGRVA